MGQDIYCDFCRASIALPEQIKQIVIGEKAVGDACLTCASSLTESLTKTRAEVEAKYKASVSAPAQLTPAPSDPATAAQVQSSREHVAAVAQEGEQNAKTGN